MDVGFGISFMKERELGFREEQKEVKECQRRKGNEQRASEEKEIGLFFRYVFLSLSVCLLGLFVYEGFKLL